MAKFVLNAKDVVVEARSLEDALQAIASHFSTIARHVGNGTPLAECGPEFDLVAGPESLEAVSLTDAVTQSKGPIALSLDPESPAGKAHAEQLAREKTEREARKAAIANAGKSDAEIMAEHSAKEQAKLNA